MKGCENMGDGLELDPKIKEQMDKIKNEKKEPRNPPTDYMRKEFQNQYGNVSRELRPPKRNP